MMLAKKRNQQTQGHPTLRRIIIYLSSLLVLWGILMFVVIPWDSSGEIPADSFALIEGQRAYAMILREQRPTLAVAIRGLNMANATYTQEKTEEGRILATGNVRIYFDTHGEFMRLELLTAPDEQARSDDIVHDADSLPFTPLAPAGESFEEGGRMPAAGQR